MDCDLCQIRSSIGYCAECKRLLCEVCSVACSECGKNVCVTHVHETHSGKRLCSACTKARKEHKHRSRREEEEAELTGFDELEQRGRARVASDEDLDDEGAVLKASAYQPIPAWKLSLYAAGAAALVMIVVLVIPGFRLIAQPWSSWISIVLCLISGFWSVVGLTSARYVENRPRNFIGAAIAVVALVLAVAALQIDTNTRGDEALEAGMLERQDLSPEELREWRRQRLDKFNPQTAPSNTPPTP